jgi:hypothetical protein
LSSSIVNGESMEGSRRKVTKVATRQAVSAAARGEIWTARLKSRALPSSFWMNS